jgi:hypothetical protein
MIDDYGADRADRVAYSASLHNDAGIVAHVTGYERDETAACLSPVGVLTELRRQLVAAGRLEPDGLDGDVLDEPLPEVAL